MFSPYYAWARRGGPADPENFCALNVALYGAGGKRWTLTERGRGGLRRDRDTLAIGPSAVTWDGDCLGIRIDEVTMPIPTRVRGTVRVYPRVFTGKTFALDDSGRHRWSPLAPMARVDVALDKPELSWSGDGYLDSNDGDAPLEQDFTEWDWSRAKTPDGAAVLYNVTRRVGADFSLALRFSEDGATEHFSPPPRADLARTSLWRVPRRTRADADGTATVRETLEDTPFYARSVISADLLGKPVTAMHESLSLDRFRLPVVQAMLPFRMPRRRR